MVGRKKSALKRKETHCETNNITKKKEILK